MIETQPNEHRCKSTKEAHILPLAECCPYSHNPRPGSFLRIEYRVNERILEVASLRAYVDSYVGGKGPIRSMEGMIQQITQDCANAVDASVWAKAFLKIEPNQEMEIECSANPTTVTPTDLNTRTTADTIEKMNEGRDG